MFTFIYFSFCLSIVPKFLKCNSHQRKLETESSLLLSLSRIKVCSTYLSLCLSCSCVKKEMFQQPKGVKKTNRIGYQFLCVIFKPTDQAGTKTSNHASPMTREQSFSPCSRSLPTLYRREGAQRRQRERSMLPSRRRMPIRTPIQHDYRVSAQRQRRQDI